MTQVQSLDLQSREPMKFDEKHENKEEEEEEEEEKINCLVVQ